RRGNIVNKTELAAKVWPGLSIDDGRLRAHILALRKALDDGSDDACTIKTIAGRGYCLIAPGSSPEAPSLAESAALPEFNCVLVGTADRAPQLPHQVDRVIGRADAIRRISELVETRRFVTVL